MEKVEPERGYTWDFGFLGRSRGFQCRSTSPQSSTQKHELSTTTVNPKPLLEVGAGLVFTTPHTFALFSVEARFVTSTNILIAFADGLGLATAVGGGVEAAKKRLASDFKSSFVRSEVHMETNRHTSAMSTQSASASAAAASVVPPPMYSNMPPPPPGGVSVPPPPPYSATATATAGGLIPPPPTYTAAAPPPPPPGGIPPPPPGNSGTAPVEGSEPQAGKKRKSRWDT